MKKIVIIIMFLAFFGFMITTPHITVLGSSDIKPTEAEMKQLYSVRKFQNMLENTGDYSSFNSEYAGAFLDEDGNLNVNVVKGSSNRFKNGLSLDSSIILNEVDYSLQELHKGRMIIEESMTELNIVSIYISVIDNSISMEISDNFEENTKKIQTLTSVSNLIMTKLTDGTSIQTTADYYMGNGDYISSGTSYFTSGVAAMNEDGDEGFITVGHVKSVVDWGDSVKVDGVTAGYYRQSDFGDLDGGNTNSDAAFVELKNTWFTHWHSTHILYNLDVCLYEPYYSAAVVPGYLITGLSLTAFGGVSGMQSGNILATDVDTYVDNGGVIVYITETVRADYVAIRGDSGAPVTYWVWVGGSTIKRMVMGIQSYSRLSDSSWIDGWSYSGFTTVDNIAENLNITYI